MVDRVSQIWTGIGIGSAVLGNVVPGFQAWPSAFNGLQKTYLIAHADSGIVEVELGVGTWTHATSTLTRDTVVFSTKGGAKVEFSVGEKHVSHVLRRADVAADADELPFSNTGTALASSVTGEAIRELWQLLDDFSITPTAPEWIDMAAIQVADAADTIWQSRRYRTATGSANAILLIPNAANEDTSTWIVRNWSSGTVYGHRAASTLPYDTLVGTFTVGETITVTSGARSGTTAIVVANAGSVLSLAVVLNPAGAPGNGLILNNDPIAGGTSGATALASANITDSSGTVDGAAFQRIVGADREGSIFVESNPGSVPVIKTEGEWKKVGVLDDDVDAAGHAILNLGGASITGAIVLGTGGSISDAGPISASGTLVKATHGGRAVLTTGNVTIPNAAGDVGMGGIIVMGGAHTITFNSTVSATLATNDVVTYYVASTTLLLRHLATWASRLTLT